jgi:hypothetical protein
MDVAELESALADPVGAAWKWKKKRGLLRWRSPEEFSVMIEAEALLNKLKETNPAEELRLRALVKKVSDELGQRSAGSHTYEQYRALKELLSRTLAPAGMSLGTFESRMKRLQGLCLHAHFLSTHLSRIMAAEWGATKRLMASGDPVTDYGLHDKDPWRSERISFIKYGIIPAERFIRTGKDYVLLVSTVTAARRPHVGPLLACVPACEALIAEKGIPVLTEVYAIAKDDDPSFCTAFLVGVSKCHILSIPELRNWYHLALAYWDMLDRSAYAMIVIRDNLGSLKPDSALQHLEFEKTDSSLIPLGGKLAGYLIRIISTEAFEAWRKAFEAGVSVEEILKDKHGRYRVIELKSEPGKIAVITKYAGEAWHRYKPRNRAERTDMEQQRAVIMEQLRALGIDHGHMHDGNFTVLVEDGRVKVRLIDFDLSWSR